MPTNPPGVGVVKPLEVHTILCLIDEGVGTLSPTRALKDMDNWNFLPIDVTTPWAHTHTCTYTHNFTIHFAHTYSVGYSDLVDGYVNSKIQLPP